MKRKVAVIGECMLELADRGGGEARFGFGGDTLNTAVYLARAGVGVDYVTDLGDDPYSQSMIAAWQAEGIDTRFVGRRPGALPGLYVIRTDATGERRFFYWRQNAPVRRMLDEDGPARLAEAFAQSALVYLSGITLSLFEGPRLDVLFAALAEARSRGVRIAFVVNYSPAGLSGVAAAREAVASMLDRCDIALPSFDDMQALFGDATPEATLDRLAAHGVDEQLVKEGGRGCVLRLGGGPVERVPVPTVVVPVDTTAAGDSFNAAYLAARQYGHAPREAALSGHHLAALVVQHRGAIVPRGLMAPGDATMGKD